MDLSKINSQMYLGAIFTIAEENCVDRLHLTRQKI